MIPRNFIDETGNRYGRLVVLKRAENNKNTKAYWLCRCDCGNETVVRGSSLRYGSTRSCGCLQHEAGCEAMRKLSEARIVDLAGKVTGKVFNKLTVVEPVRRKGCKMWLCKCECGKETVVRLADLRNSHVRSCGCLRPGGGVLEEGMAAFNALIRGMERHAKKVGVSWKLTKEQVRSLVTQRCYYCGIEPKKRTCFGSNHYNGTFFANGLDRQNNSLGYIIDNVVPCCKTCNMAKRAMTVEQFKLWVIRVYEKFCRR